MIVKTTTEINGVTYNHTYSDIGMKIERNGVRYDEAIDPLNSDRQYTETDEPINTQDLPTDEIPAEELKTMIEEVLGYDQSRS